MKLVTTALEWIYQTGEPDVRAETLELAAQLLVLRHDTLWIIDGAGPIVEAPAPEAGEQEMRAERNENRKWREPMSRLT